MAIGFATPPAPQRVIAYIDGFNLYYGMRAAGLRSCYWLDLSAMASKLLKPHQALQCTKYFTARIGGARPGDGPVQAANREAKRKRQAVYLDAIATIPGLVVFEGHYLLKPRNCFACGNKVEVAEEKMTDVNIATELLMDTFLDNYDLAIVISGDTDLVPPIRKIRAFFPHKHVVVCFPPSRANKQLKMVCSGCMHIFPKTLHASLLPDPVIDANGNQLAKPPHWS